MGFQFPLSVVLQVRLRAEEREEHLLKQIQAELAKTTLSLREFDTAISSAHGKRIAIAGASTTGLDLSARYGEIENLNLQRAALAEHVQKLEQLREKQMDAYRLARRNRETLDQLLDEQRAAHQHGANQREQRTTNDIAVGQHVRKKSGSYSRNTSRE